MKTRNAVSWDDTPPGNATRPATQKQGHSGTTTPLSPHWDTQGGTALCVECLREWPCHFSAWLMGNQDCPNCKLDGVRHTLEWNPNGNF